MCDHRLPSALLAIVLAVSPGVGQTAAPVDHLGDPLPAGALYRIGTNRLQFAGGDAIAASPDSKLIAGIEFGRVAVWEAATGREIAGLDLNGLHGDVVLFTPDGKCVGFSKDHSLALLDLTSKKLREIRVGGMVSHAAFAPDGKTVTTVSFFMGSYAQLLVRSLLGLDDSQRDKVGRWDVASGKMLKSYPWPPEEAHPYNCLSPDGRMYVTFKNADSQTPKPMLHLRDTATGAVRYRWPVPGSVIGQPPVLLPDVERQAFSGDAKRLALRSEDGTIRVLEITSGKEIGHFKLGTKKTVRGLVAFSPDGESLYCGTGMALTRWDWRTGKKVREYRDAWRSLAFLAGGKTLAVVGRKGMVRLVDAETGSEIGSRPCVGTSVAFSPDCRHVAWAEGEALVLANAANGMEQRRWPAEMSPESPVAFSPDGKMLATGGAGRTHVWETSSGREIGLLPSVGNVTFLEFAPDGRRLASGNGAIANLWEFTTGKCLETWKGTPQVVVAGGIKAVATTESKARKTRLFDPLTKKVLRPIDGFRETVSFQIRPFLGGITTNSGVPMSPLFAPDGRLVLLPGDIDRNSPDFREWDEKFCGLFVWEVATGKRLPPVFRGDAMILDKVAFSHDAALLAVMHSDCTMCLVSTATGQEIRRLGKGQGEMTARPIFTPDGRILVTAGGGLFQRGLVQFWEIATGGEIARREGHKGSVKAFVVSADGRLLATVSDDHTILVWDLARLFPDDPSAPASTESLWMELANQNAQLGRRAIERLIASPVPAIQLLREHLKPVEGPDAKELARLIADLDVSGFEQRERGEQALGQLAELAESAQRKALAGNPSAEARRRIENLLAKLDPWRMSIEQVRVVRAVQALEGIGNVEARRLLADWAGGAAGARLTKEATAACTRLRASQ